MVPQSRLTDSWPLGLPVTACLVLPGRLNMLVCNYDLENKVCRSGNGDWEYKHIGVWLGGSEERDNGECCKPDMAVLLCCCCV